MGTHWNFLAISALFLVTRLPYSSSQFPSECVLNVDWTSHAAKSCCPNNCGGSNHGTCEILQNGTDGQYNQNDKQLQGRDDRYNWPHVFFKYGCRCKGNFMGIDCGACKWGYTGVNCDQKKTLLRQNVKSLSTAEKKAFFETLAKAKDVFSDTQILVEVSDDLLNKNIDKSYPFKNTTEYNVFAWMHYYSTRDTRLDDIHLPNCTLKTKGSNNFCNINDFAHESTGFLTWHRAFLLLMERTLQRISGNHSMTIPYWDWRDEPEGGCSVCTEEYVGSVDGNSGEITNGYFADWEVICYNVDQYYDNNTICPATNEGKIKRFPGTNPAYKKLPTSEDVHRVLLLQETDTPPYDVTSTSSFRNGIEGFLDLVKDVAAGDNDLHPLHNHVHLYMGEHSTMRQVPSATNDPIFWLHHCFIDNIFEKWLRMHNISNSGIPPYPEGGANIGHNLKETMIPFFPVITHEDMYHLSTDLGYDYDDMVSEGNGLLRLVDGNYNNAGRLEIAIGNQWYRVCSLNFGNTEGKVACKQLGFTDLKSYDLSWYPRGDGPYALHNIDCTGSESKLINCEHAPFFQRHSLCGEKTHNDVGLICVGNATEGDVRIVDGTQYEGRVEIYHNGQWGRICKTGWSRNDANVLCRQLGYGTARQYYSSGWNPRSGGSFWLYNIDCSGSETKLTDCSHPAWGVTNCDKNDYDDAAVLCASAGDGSLRLFNNNTIGRGGIEVYYSGRWGRVCYDNYWGYNDVKVACRHLGFDGAWWPTYVNNWTPRSSSSDFFLMGVNCIGNEQRLDQCDHNGVKSDSSCHAANNDDPGVMCNAPGDGSIRLADGNGVNNGRLEIQLGGGWYRICWKGFDQTDANVACRQLGFSGAVAVYDSWVPRGSGEYALRSLNCIGTESRLVDCDHPEFFRTWHSCRLTETDDAAVTCALNITGPGTLRLVNGNTYNEGRLEVEIGDSWYRVCQNGFGTTDGQVACKQMGHLGLDSYTTNWSPKGSGPYALRSLACAGTESKLINCIHADFFKPSVYCREDNFDDVGLICVPNRTLSITTETLTWSPWTATKSTSAISSTIPPFPNFPDNSRSGPNNLQNASTLTIIICVFISVPVYLYERV